MYCLAEMSGWIETGQECEEKGLWYLAYQCYRYTLWCWHNCDMFVESLDKFVELEERALKLKHRVWWKMSPEDQAIANGPFQKHSFDEHTPGLGQYYDPIFRWPWSAPE